MGSKIGGQPRGGRRVIRAGEEVLTGTIKEDDCRLLFWGVVVEDEPGEAELLRDVKRGWQDGKLSGSPASSWPGENKDWFLQEQQSACPGQTATRSGRFATTAKVFGS